MEGLLILIAIYVLLVPLILVGVAVAQHKRMRRLQARVDELELRARSGDRAPGAEEEKPRTLPIIPPVVAAPAVPAPAPAPAPSARASESPAPVEPPAGPRRLVHARGSGLTDPAPGVHPAEPSPPAAPAHAGAVAAGGRLREFLQGIGMWPPASAPGRDREAILMQWWLPRIGGLLALLSALFFGVYINQSTAPWFKCLEMAVVSLAIAGLGRFLERRNRSFGGVLVVTGLIMLYLTSVAAYVLPATRVIGDPLTGSLVQAAVLALITWIGFLRRSEGLVLLAFIFGYLLGIFMVWEGLREGALIAAGLLFAAGALLARVPVFRHLVWVSIPGSFAVTLAYPFLAYWTVMDVPSSSSVQVFLNVIFAGVTFLALSGGLGEGRPRRILISIGSSLAVLCLVTYFREFDPEVLDWAALFLGLNMLAGALYTWARRSCGFLAQLLFIKASFLVALWAILHFAGDLRWMVLAVETVVVALAARRSRAVAMEWAAWAVALASFYFHVNSPGSVPRPDAFAWWLGALYPAVVLLGLALLLPVFQIADRSWRKQPRLWAYALVPVTAWILWINYFDATPQRFFDLATPFIVLVFAFGALGVLRVFSRWMVLMTAGLCFIAASGFYCDSPFSIVQLAAILVAAAAALHFLVRMPSKGAAFIENLTLFFSLLPLTLWILQTLDNWEGQGAVAYALAGVVLLLGALPRMRHTGAWSFLPVLVFLLSESVRDVNTGWSLIAIACGLVWIALPMTDARVRGGLGWARRLDLWSVIGMGLIWSHTSTAAFDGADWMTWQTTFAVIGGLFLAAASAFRVKGYYFGAMLFIFSGYLGLARAVEPGSFVAYSPWVWEALLSAGLLYALLLGWFFARPVPFSFNREAARNAFERATSAALAILIFLLSVVIFRYEALNWMAWYTPALAVTSFGIILLGLAFRDRVFRFVGLLSLMVPLLRLFFVDVQDVLHRIVAFAAAAVLLTLLGYLYHRLSSRLNR